MREPSQSCIEQPHATPKRAAFQMMVRSSDLNQALEELFEIGFRREPELFPRFVSVPEFESVEVLDAAKEDRHEIRLH